MPRKAQIVPTKAILTASHILLNTEGVPIDHTVSPRSHTIRARSRLHAHTYILSPCASALLMEGRWHGNHLGPKVGMDGRLIKLSLKWGY